jgi:hypothetical protein
MPKSTALKPARIPKGYVGCAFDDGRLARWYDKRRHLAAAIDLINGKPELQYIIDISDLESAMLAAFKRIRRRDGAKVFKEAAKNFRHDVDGCIARLGR